MVDILGTLEPWSPLIGTFVVLMWARALLKRDIKSQQIRSVFQQLGIQKFSPESLNADKLDDKGFQRLCQILQLVSPGAAKSGGAAGDLAGIVGLMQAMSAAKSNVGQAPEGQVNVGT